MTRGALVAGAAVVLAATAAYASSIDNYFAQDDFGVVWLLSQKSVGDFPGWFVSTWMDDIWGYTPDEIRPFPALSYQVASLAGAGSPVANHIINIAVHAASGLLVFMMARTATGVGRAGAAVGALVFVLLPNQAESVAWVTGRVDSLPSFVYLASFLAYARWRATPEIPTENVGRVLPGRRSSTSEVGFFGPAAYITSVALCFVALFCKQNTITLGPALVLYDLIVLRRPVRFSWAWIRPYVPFAALTVGYLALRYVLFEQVIRESLLTPASLRVARGAIADHLLRIVIGDTTLRGNEGRWIGAAIVVLVLIAAWLWKRGRQTTRPARGLVYFGVAWIALGLAPSLVAGYSSPRHAYLASVGWALVIAVLFDVAWRATKITPPLKGGPPRLLWRPPSLMWGPPSGGPRQPLTPRIVACLAATALLATYSVQLRRQVGEWETRTAVSARAVTDLDREARAAPPGTLILAGAPLLSWAYALPFAARPPFASENLEDRVSVISHSSLHCCGAVQWDSYTRQTLREWLARPDRPPVIAMYWEPRTGRLSRLSDIDDPYLRTLMQSLIETEDRAALDSNITRVVTEFVALRRPSS